MKPRILVALFIGLTLVAGAAQGQASEPERLRIQGSHRLGEHVVPALVDQWLRDIGYSEPRHVIRDRATIEIHASRDEESLVVEIRRTDTASGLAALIDGATDLSMSTREPDAAELDRAWQLGNLRSPTQEWVLGLDGVVVLVPEASPLSALGTDQLRAIITGSERDWSALGGMRGPITLHALDRAPGTLELAGQLLAPGRGPAVPKIVHASQAALLAAVAADPGAIALVGLRASRKGVKTLAVRVGANTLFPERASVIGEDYPLLRRIYLHTGTLLPALGRSFSEYVVSAAGQAIVERSPFASVGLRLMGPVAREAMPTEYHTLLGAAERLPVTLRFSTGFDLFDSRSRQDINRLISFMEKEENLLRRVVLMSFANPQPGAPYQALSNSHERVDYVASELKALGIRVSMARGFGGQAALMDPGQPGAAYRNNRVELWVR